MSAFVVALILGKMLFFFFFTFVCSPLPPGAFVIPTECRRKTVDFSGD